MLAATLTIAILSLLLLAFIAYIALSSRHKKASRAPFDLIGRAGSVERELNPEGHVIVDGELWPARSRDGGRVARGLHVRVVGARGLALEVELFDEP